MWTEINVSVLCVMYVLGDHGYDNSLPNMHPIFIAHGPAFKKGYKAEPFESVDLYPLLCHLLDIEPRPNNGSLEAIRHILAGSDNLDITLITCKLVFSLFITVSSICSHARSFRILHLMHFFPSCM